MGRAIDLFVTYRFIKLLVTPFEKTEAFKLGIIDEFPYAHKEKESRVDFQILFPTLSDNGQEISTNFVFFGQNDFWLIVMKELLHTFAEKVPQALSRPVLVLI